MANNKPRVKKHSFFKTLLWLLVLAAAAYLLYIFFLGPSLIPSRDAAREQGMIVSDDSFNLLLVGSDYTQLAAGAPRADTIILANVRPATQQLFLLSIPRDSLVEIEGYGSDKINHSFAYGGMELLTDTVERNLQVPVDYYLLTDFGGFESIIDALGGVEINVDKRMYYHTYDGLIDIEAGLQLLDGEKALQYVRYRHDELGDITRVSRQQNLLKALYAKLSEPGIYRKLPQILPRLFEAVDTDMSKALIVRAAIAMKDAPAESVEAATLAGDFANIDGVSYWRLDEAAGQQMLLRYFGAQE
ncbi:MAG: LCP family protein [Bacillota bacterium]|nr:LCP family protein [Bacillota bacterium]